MTEFVIVRNSKDELIGASPDDQRAWLRFKRRVKGLERGELMKIEATIPRNPMYHRKFFALLRTGFDAWVPPMVGGDTPQKNFEQFREDITILAGYSEAAFDIDGNLRLRAQSISFGSMEQPQFEALYSAVVNVLLERVLTTYADREELDLVVEKIMGFVEQ